VKQVSWTDWKSLPSFRRNLRNTISVLQSKNVELIMCSQPYLYKEGMSPEEMEKLVLWPVHCRNEWEMPDLQSMIAGLEEFNHISRAVAQDNGLVFVDLAKVVPKTPEYFVDDFHFTAEGNRVIGEALSKAVVANGFLDRKMTKISPGFTR
jgi:lysophospholipase L1-like esterase